MEVVVLDRLEAAPLVWQSQAGRLGLTLICKLTYELGFGTARPALQQQLVQTLDLHWNDEPTASICSPTDLVPFKAKPEVVLVGSAFAPRGTRVQSLSARLVVGDVDKTIDVYGSRTERVLASGERKRGSTARFAYMPLLYEYAPGGADTANPVGMAARPDATSAIALPNLQAPTTKTAKRPVAEPLGFGPIGADWPTRRQRLRRLLATWHPRSLTEMPVPDGLDPAFFNCAPADQFLASLEVDQQIELHNIHPDHSVFKTRLAGYRPRARVQRPSGTDDEISLTADTLWISLDATAPDAADIGDIEVLCTVTWRGTVPLESRNEEGRVLVLLEAPGRTVDWTDANRRADERSPLRRRPVPPARASLPSGVDPRLAEVAALAATIGAKEAAPQPRQSTRGLDASTPPPRPASPASSGDRPEPGEARAAMAALEPPAQRPPLPAPPPPIPPLPPPFPATPGLVAPPPSSRGFAARAVATGESPTQPLPLPLLLKNMTPPLATPPQDGSLPGGLFPATTTSPAQTGTIGQKAIAGAAPPTAAVVDITARERARRGEPEMIAAPVPAITSGAAGPPQETRAPVALSALESSNAALSLGVASSVVDSASRPVTPAHARPIRAPSALESVSLLWVDSTTPARVRRHPTFRPLLEALQDTPRDHDLDDPMSSPDAMDIDDRRDVLEILTNGAPLSGEALQAAAKDAIRDDGKFVPPFVLCAGELQPVLDDAALLSALVATVTATRSPGDPVPPPVEIAKELLALPGLLLPPPVAGTLQKKIHDAYRDARRGSSGPGVLEEHAELAAVLGRKYQFRQVFGAPHLRAYLAFPGAPRMVAYVPADAASLLPLEAKFRVRLLAEVHLPVSSQDPGGAVLRLSAVARTLKRTP